jgi:hypothetical protein
MRGEILRWGCCGAARTEGQAASAAKAVATASWHKIRLIFHRPKTPKRTWDPKYPAEAAHETHKDTDNFLSR